MARLSDFAVTNFSGGMVRNKSDYEMQRNEVKLSLNLEFDDLGRVVRRRGYQRMGANPGGTLKSNIVPWTFINDSTSLLEPQLFILGRESSSGDLFKMVSSSLATAITTASITVVLRDSGAFAASGAVEIEGDIISYTGNTGGTETLTGVTGIRVAHPVGAAVNQWTSVINTGLDFQDGAYACVFQNPSANAGNQLIIGGRQGGCQIGNGSSVTAITDGDEQSGLFHTIYRNRLVTAGSGLQSGVSPYPARMAYSNADNFTSWTASDFYDFEENRGEPITGFNVLNDQLHVFKYNSIMRYNEIEVKKELDGVGAYNHYSVQEIEGKMYTICPGGVYVTNGSSAKLLSQKIAEFLKYFYPTFNLTTARVINNIYTAKWNKKFLILLGDLNNPYDLDDVVLVYDTLKDNWTIWNGFTNFSVIKSEMSFGMCGNAAVLLQQPFEGLFGTDGTTVFRMFENRTVDSSGVIIGGDIIPDAVDNSAGVAVNCILETQLYDLGSPSYEKSVEQLRVFIEQGDWNVEIKLDRNGKISDWKQIGNVSATNQEIQIPKECRTAKRFALRFTNSQMAHLAILSGFVFEGIETQTKQDSGIHGRR